VEKIAANAGDKVQFNDVLMVGGTVGTPFIEDAGVQAEVIDQIRGPKVINFVKRRRKHSSQRTKGHRQNLTLVRITEILEKGAAKSGVAAAMGAGSVSGAALEAAKPAKKAAAKPAKAEAKAPKAAAKPAAKAETKAAEAADDLTAITGIGPAAAKKLADAGITSYAQLAAVDVDSFDAVKIKPEWVDQAKALAK
jgi:large subunit ribosomal protein L21